MTSVLHVMQKCHSGVAEVAGDLVLQCLDSERLHVLLQQQNVNILVATLHSHSSVTRDPGSRSVISCSRTPKEC